MSPMSERDRARAPVISVVVPARDAESTLPLLLAALDRLDFDEPWELVFVDDASTDATAAMAEEWGARVVRLTGQGGPAAARNAGLAAARAPLVAFTDADCEPSPEWLSAVKLALADADLATGPVLPVGPRGRPFDRTLRITAESLLFETANLAVRKDVSDRIGGFEPFAPTDDGRRLGMRPEIHEGHFGEDAVFGWKVRRMGARTVFVDDAVVYHAVFPRGPRGWIAERKRLRFFPALMVEVPEFRDEVAFRRLFLSRRTARFDLAVAGLLGAVLARNPLPLVCAYPYAAKHLTVRQSWRRSIARRNLAWIVGDAVGLVALVRGSIAARRLLL